MHLTQLSPGMVVYDAMKQVLVSSSDDRSVRIWPLYKIDYREPPPEKVLAYNI